MAIRGRNILKGWFKRGDKPLAEQFGDWIDSFLHKTEDKIPMSSVENLNETLNNKANITALNAHVTNTNNPHNVTAAQIGAATGTDIQNLQTQITQNTGDIEVINVEIDGIRQEMAEHEHFRGYYATTAEIQAIPNPHDGDYAYNAQTGTKWAYANSAWTDTSVSVPDQVVPKSTTVPKMDGTASVGSEEAYAAGDHVHPTDITRVSNTEFDAFKRNINSDVLDRAKNAIHVNFGGNRNTITTNDFIEYLINSAAFFTSTWNAMGTFSVSENQILDTESVGKIDLSGCSVHLESYAEYGNNWDISGYTITFLTTTGNTTDGTEANRLYTYTKYGTDAGIWAKFVTNYNIPANLDPYLYKYNWDTVFADSNGRNVKFFEGTEASPDGNAALFGFQENTGTGYGMQFGISQRDKAFFRSKAANVVGQWNEIWHSNNLPYEENAWNPMLAARNGSDGSIIPVEGTFDLKIGRYKRRGNTVYLYGNLQGAITNATALTGHAVVITNVPFNAKPYIAAAGSMQYSFGVAGLSISMGIANFAQNYLYIGRNSNGTSASLSTAVWGTDMGTGFFQIRFSIEYEI